MRDVYVLGVGMIKFGRYPDKDVPQLGAEAALLALKDAGMTIKDVEMFVCGNLFQANAMNAQRILQQIGQTGIPALNVSNACATGSTAVREAYMGVASGMYDVTMAVGVEQMGKMGLLGGGARSGGESVEGVLGSGLMPAVFGQAGVEHMRKYGTTAEQFAKVSVKNHKHSVHNPLAQYQMNCHWRRDESAHGGLPEHPSICVARLVTGRRRPFWSPVTKPNNLRMPSR